MFLIRFALTRSSASLGPFIGGNCPGYSSVGSGNEFVYEPNPNSDNDSPNFFNHPSQPQYETYSCELCGNDSHCGYDCPPWAPLVYEHEPSYNQNYDEVKSIREILEKTSFDAITPEFLITNSLSMRDEHLSTISEIESDELIKSSVENLVLKPSESEDLFDIKSECNMPVCDDFMTFSNSLVPHHFNAESDLKESFLNQDSSIISSPKIDYLLEEFSGELAHIDLISLGINEADFDPEEEIRLVEKLLYDNSSPQEFNSKNSDTPDDDLWREHSILGWTVSPFLSPLTNSRLPRILKTLMLVVLSIIHSSFTSLASFRESNILNLID
nr:hypothetical protein [Tanacetum cinerariifolium]